MGKQERLKGELLEALEAEFRDGNNHDERAAPLIAALTDWAKPLMQPCRDRKSVV